MELKVTGIAKLLQVSTKTIYRWVDEGRIPFYRVNRQYRFDTRQIEEWAAEQGRVPKKNRPGHVKPGMLMDLIERGGIHYHLEGTTMIEAICQAVGLFPELDDVRTMKLLETLIHRERMQCTGIGAGIAIPHPRVPVIDDAQYEFVAICMTETPIFADTVDSEDVHTLLFVICADEFRQMRMIAELSHLCRKKQFTEMLRGRALRSKLSIFIKKSFN